MAEEQDLYVVMSWASESSVSESGEPEGFVHETNGNLLVENDDGRSPVGKFRLYYVDVGRAIDEGMSVFDVFDTYSETVNYHDALFGANSPEFDDRLLKVLGDDVFGRNVLVLDRLEILPSYRRRGLGLSVMRHMIRRFAVGTAVIAIKPFPLQFEVEPSTEDEKKWRAALALPTVSVSQRNATKKLCDYYGRLGFVRLIGTPFMVRASARTLPPT